MFSRHAELVSVSLSFRSRALGRGICNLLPDSKVEILVKAQEFLSPILFSESNDPIKINPFT